jgi:hypothetical protein
MHGFNPIGALDIQFPAERRQSLVASLSANSLDVDPNEEVHYTLVVDFIIQSEIQQRAFSRSLEYVKDCKNERHGLSVHGEQNYAPGNFVMLFDYCSTGLKLRSA